MVSLEFLSTGSIGRGKHGGCLPSYLLWIPSALEFTTGGYCGKGGVRVTAKPPASWDAICGLRDWRLFATVVASVVASDVDVVDDDKVRLVTIGSIVGSV